MRFRAGLQANSPFVGYSLQSKEQKSDILSVYVDENGKPYKTAGKIDYVAGWYFKAAEFIQNTKIRAAFVSTNSITQGEQVAAVWQPLYEHFGIHIDFAHRTFRWDSESTDKAHVNCVIVGFSAAPNNAAKKIFTDGKMEIAANINPYLIAGENVFIESRKKPLCDIPEMIIGNRPADGGNLIIEAADYENFIAKEWAALKYIKLFVGANEFINNRPRYCLWLVGVSPAELRKMPEVLKRVEACRQDRLNSPDAGRRKLADTPALFREISNPEKFIVIPEISSEKHKYIPIDFLNADVICTNRLKIIPNANLYHFGILNSNVHMAWMRASCGRLEMRYCYSIKVVYIKFPWPFSTPRNCCAISAPLKGGYGEAMPLSNNPLSRGSVAVQRQQGGACETADISCGAKETRSLDSTPRNCSAISAPLKGGYGEAALKAAIEKTAQGILDARALYPDSSLADLYDETAMPTELRAAHRANDKAMMAAYGFSLKMNEEQCVAELMKMYQNLVRS